MTDSRLAKAARIALAVFVVSAVAGCDTMDKLNPFTEKKTPLAGERHPVPRVAPPPPDTVPQPLSALPDDVSSNFA